MNEERLCLYLRYKKMLYTDPNQPPSDWEKDFEELFGKADITFCWCERTQTARGPDDQPVSTSDCSRPARSCYRGLRDLGVEV